MGAAQAGKGRGSRGSLVREVAPLALQLQTRARRVEMSIPPLRMTPVKAGSPPLLQVYTSHTSNLGRVLSKSEWRGGHGNIY